MLIFFPTSNEMSVEQLISATKNWLLFSMPPLCLYSVAPFYWNVLLASLTFESVDTLSYFYAFGMTIQTILYMDIIINDLSNNDIFLRNAVFYRYFKVVDEDVGNTSYNQYFLSQCIYRYLLFLLSSRHSIVYLSQIQ